MHQIECTLHVTFANIWTLYKLFVFVHIPNQPINLPESIPLMGAYLFGLWWMCIIMNCRRSAMPLADTIRSSSTVSPFGMQSISYMPTQCKQIVFNQNSLTFQYIRRKPFIFTLIQNNFDKIFQHRSLENLQFIHVFLFCCCCCSCSASEPELKLLYNGKHLQGKRRIEKSKKKETITWPWQKPTKYMKRCSVEHTWAFCAREKCADSRFYA